MESSNQAKSILLTPTDIDRLTDRIKELEDALAEEIKLADALLADVRRLVEAAKCYLEDKGHSSYCNAIHGPEHEEWIVEEDCDCESKKLKQAIAAIERHL